MKRHTPIVIALTAALTLPLSFAVPSHAAQIGATASTTIVRATVSPVKSLSVTTVSSTKAKISWKKTPKASSYEVSVSGKRYKTSKTSLIVKTSANKSVKVRSFVNGKASSWSAAKYVAPVKVSKPTISKSGVLAATVTWPKVSGAAKYELKVGSRVYVTTKLKKTVDVRSDAKVNVRAIGTKGQKGAWSSSTYRTPITVTSVKVFADSTYLASLQWKSVPGADSYEVKVNNTISSSWTNYDTLWAEAGDKIYVRAVVGSKKGAWSAPVVKKLNKDERTDLFEERSYYEQIKADYNAEIITIISRISDLNYWRAIAVDYGNTARVQQIDAEIGQLNTDANHYRTWVREAQAEIDRINNLLKLGA